MVSLRSIERHISWFDAARSVRVVLGTITEVRIISDLNGSSLDAPESAASANLRGDSYERYPRAHHARKNHPHSWAPIDSELDGRDVL